MQSETMMGFQVGVDDWICILEKKSILEKSACSMQDKWKEEIEAGEIWKEETGTLRQGFDCK